MLKNNDILETKNAELMKSNKELRQKPSIDIDSLMQPTPLQQQYQNLIRLFDTVIEVHALEDTIYYRSKAFNGGDLHGFIKCMRGLSRDVFLKKLLINQMRGIFVQNV